MSKPVCDLNSEPPSTGAVLFSDPIDLPGAPPASPNGRVLYENLGISIDKDGIWHYHGSPIRRKELVCLFAQALTRDNQGNYWLVTPAEMGQIQVADTPLLVVEMFVGGEGERQTISLRTNVDEIVTVDDEHPLHIMHDPQTGEAMPYLRLDRRIDARVIRSVFYDLVALGVETEMAGRPCLSVRSSGRMFSLGWLDEAS